MRELLKLNKLLMIIDIELAIANVMLTSGLERETASRLVAGGIELLLEEEIGLIVNHRYVTSKDDLYMYGSGITNIIKNIKTDFWPLVIEHIPTFTDIVYTGSVDLVHDHLVEIKIVEGKNES